MSADGGLGELQDVAQLGDAELVALEQTQEAQAGWIGEGFHPREQGLGLLRRCVGGVGGRRLIHPMIRMNC